MPWFRLVDMKTNKTLKTRRLDHEVANEWNADLNTDERKWIMGLDRTGRPAVKTLSHILRNLDVEGFDDHSMSTIESWLTQQAKEASYERKRYELRRKRFGKFMREQTPEARRVVGKFMSSQLKHSFEAGIRAGLAAYLVKEHEKLFGDNFAGADDPLEVED